ncbi:hypothetical protein [Moraxella marmotae]|uniref:hypothetical protein n=1 Tax=Moraxella marmotae TaxID=3344520 RepID=UPI0035F38571
MKYFVCVEFDQYASVPTCKYWTELDETIISSVSGTQPNFLFSDLANLSHQDASILLSLTATLFALAWVWRLLSKQAFR